MSSLNETGPLELPLVNPFPKVPFTTPFCLIPRIVPSQPSAKESVIVMVTLNPLRSGQPPIGQKLANRLSAVYVEPLVLWWMMVPLGALITNAT